MKSRTIKTPIAELLIVELPEGSEPLSLIGNSFFYYEKDMVKEDYPKSLTLATSYTLLGKPDEIKEDSAKELVENIWNGFKNYSEPHDSNVGNYQRLVVNTAKESLFSLLESEIYWENPFGDREPTPETHILLDSFELKSVCESWHIAQSRTFDRNRTLIFKKVTPKI